VCVWWVGGGGLSYACLCWPCDVRVACPSNPGVPKVGPMGQSWPAELWDLARQELPWLLLKSPIFLQKHAYSHSVSVNPPFDFNIIVRIGLMNIYRYISIYIYKKFVDKKKKVCGLPYWLIAQSSSNMERHRQWHRDKLFQKILGGRIFFYWHQC